MGHTNIFTKVWASVIVATNWLKGSNVKHSNHLRQDMFGSSYIPHSNPKARRNRKNQKFARQPLSQAGNMPRMRNKCWGMN